MNALETTVRRALYSDRYALIGAGQLGEMSLAMWPRTVPKPEFFLDTVKRGTLKDIPVHDLAPHAPIPGIVYLLSAFKLPATEAKAIFERLGQDQVLTVYDLFEQAIPDLFGNGWRNLSPLPQTRARLEALSQCFVDERSALAAQAAVAWRYRRELEDNAPIGPEAEKYDLGLFGRAGIHYDYVFDCGSHDLSLIACLESAGISFRSYIAFEADPACFKACANIANGLSESVRDRLCLRDEAVSDRAGFEPFLASGLLSARLLDRQGADGPVIAVPTTTLDAVANDIGAIAPEKRCLIKLHIEGAELQALSGAAKILKGMKTDLLINVSHNERQFIEVPALLAQHDCFDIHLRSHSLFGEGLTLFARHKS